MSRLFATVDWSNNIVHFSGPGTFDARDEIKQLGIAVWRGEKKTWEVRVEVLVIAELTERFPGLVIEELGTPGSKIERAAPGVDADIVPAGGRSQVPSGLSVSQVIAKSRAALKAAFPSTICVYGVLSQVKARDGGVVFMELAEAERPDERLSCAIWGHAESMCRKLHEAGFRLEPNLQVMFEAEVNLSNKDGRLSLRVVRIIAEYTLAKLAALRDQTNDRLKKEGLFDRNKRLSLAFLPRRLGIITSSGGTVINDFRASLDEAEFGFELLWLPVPVQGNEAKAALLRAINGFSKFKHLDAVLIFRGGGSQADLAVFNDYDVARAVCLLDVPVISAIGHQEDQSSVQDVSWKALGVPKDIGRFFADIVLRYRQSITLAASAVLRLGSLKVEQWTQAVSRSPILALAGHVLGRKAGELQAAMHRVSDGKQRRFEAGELRFAGMRRQTLASMLHLVERAGIQLDGVERLVLGAAPETQLRRGFTMVRDEESGKYLLDGAEVPKEATVVITFRDGERRARMEDGKQ